MAPWHMLCCKGHVPTDPACVHSALCTAMQCNTTAPTVHAQQERVAAAMASEEVALRIAQRLKEERAKLEERVMRQVRQTPELVPGAVGGYRTLSKQAVHCSR